MAGKTTLSIVAVKNRKRNYTDTALLQTLPSELEEVELDIAFLLRATGLWAILSRAQRSRAKRLAPRLVAVVDQDTRRITGRAPLRR
ncbi:hypothetical protein [Ensifer sp. SSB1]|jgi:hypothetical protein|uniref:hypothetical protein n=1 Tax=Ensifer sp. SSB1 TaxID=2795385 RepID=UPI001A587F94|nr:hypothetical protein [Ensifer sp. SSB1]MBK5571606.1 hypothetical protein [Ensifer sp. SSB1]